jgi:hypothetical protein
MKLDDQFEWFANYCIVNKEYDSIRFELKSTLTGRGTQGIDGVAIIVNNKLCSTVQEIEDLIQMNRILNVTFVFIQSKISAKFEGTEIEGFLRWVKVFFDDDAEEVFKTDEMKNFIDMKNYIYNNSQFMKERNPICKLYYVCNGSWQNDDSLVTIIEKNKSELDNTNLFEKVEFQPCDSKKLQNLYRKTKEPNSAKIHFEKKVSLPPIPGVEVAYSGLLPFSEYRKIIIDDDGNMKSVYDDNIRDYLEQDDNPVNKDINDTLKEGKFEHFCILNNGVTVVAEQISGAGDNLFITNYQIVNGCQTSHVLYDNRNKEGIERVYIPLKIIITNDYDIKSQITRATNNQTAVGIEQLEALSEFQKNLELFYNALPNDDLKIFYERRTNQYRDSDIESYRIINIETQIKVFAAMFLNKAHQVAGYYGKLTREIGGEIFDSEHKLEPYYISSITYTMIEDAFNKGIISDELWRLRYHILMLYRMVSAGPNIPPMNSKKIIEYCNKIIDSLKNKDIFSDIIMQSVNLIMNASHEINIKDRKVSERKSTTDTLIKNFFVKEI